MKCPQCQPTFALAKTKLIHVKISRLVHTRRFSAALPFQHRVKNSHLSSLHVIKRYIHVIQSEIRVMTSHVILKHVTCIPQLILIHAVIIIKRTACALQAQLTGIRDSFLNRKSQIFLLFEQPLTYDVRAA